MSGTFYGYRELAKPPKKNTPFWAFTPPDPELRLEYWQWDVLGPVPFQYQVYRGSAEDDYQVDFVSFPFQTHLILGFIRDAPAYITLTYDGLNEQPERRFDLGFMRLEAAMGFKIRNAEPGISSRYQIVVMR